MIPTRTLTAVRTYTRGVMRSALRGLPMGLQRFLGMQAEAASLLAWGAQKNAEDLAKDIVPSKDSSFTALSNLAFLIGLPDGQGGYGALLPTPASGGAATGTGVQGTVYPAGLTGTADDGATQVEVSSKATIPGSGSGSGSVALQLDAITPGSVGNLPAGTVITWDSPPPGADPTITLTSELTDGGDTESPAALLLRIYERLQLPTRGGANGDYPIWAEAIKSIKGVYVYPRRSGTGTVDVVLTVGGSGQARVPQAGVVQAVAAALKGVQPATIAQLNLMAPTAPDANGHLVRVRVAPVVPFDWDDTAGPLTIGSYTPGSLGAPDTLTLSSLPASLTAAITAYMADPTLQAPRLQILSTGANALPSLQVRAVSLSGSTITLESPLPSGWSAPNIGDAVYAGGPAVDTIAAAILDYCNSLGPSRVGGYADDLSPWLDTLSVNSIIGLAEDATDAGGADLITKVLSGGCTIDGSAADAQGIDNGRSAPELLWLEHIAVTA